MNRVDVLDKGYVELLDVMGDDQAIVDAARVSIKNMKASSTNEKLIKYLMANKHMSPFEMVEFKFTTGWRDLGTRRAGA